MLIFDKVLNGGTQRDPKAPNTQGHPEAPRGTRRHPGPARGMQDQLEAPRSSQRRSQRHPEAPQRHVKAPRGSQRQPDPEVAGGSQK